MTLLPKWITCIKREEKEVKMDFDITKEPPTEAEIKAERIRLKKKIKVIDTHAFTGVALEGFKLRLSLWEPALIPACKGVEFPLY